MIKEQSLIEGWQVYFQPKMLAILVLGLVSGLPLALTASTLGVWLTEAGVSKSAIGLFAAVSTPYALKFLWSPLIDAVAFPGLCRMFGRRRGWMIATQIGLILGIALLGLADPQIDPWLTALCALIVAVFSASQDIVIDAYRVEILEPEQYGAGAATIVLGYRLGMILSSAGALFLATRLGWTMTYWIMAGLVGIGIVTVLLAGEPARSKAAAVAWQGDMVLWLRQAVAAPLGDFMRREHWLAILLFILLYKLADAFMGVMTNPFLIDIGFSKDEIATVVKFYGVVATIVGSFIGGWMTWRIGTTRTLWVCGIGHALTNLMFVVQAKVGADIGILALSITLENVTGGMGTAAFVAFMSSLTNVRFTATQYALLSSFSAFGRTWLSTPAGWFSELLGWQGFFLLASLLAIPGLAVLWWLGSKMKDNWMKDEQINTV